MVEGALNAAAEIVIERTAYGNLLERDGNRGPDVAPQGLYPCRGLRPLARGLGRDRRAVARAPGRARRPAVGERSRARRPTPDGARNTTCSTRALAEWSATRDADDAAALLLDHGVPAAAPRDPRLLLENPQLQARGFHEAVDHPVVGRLLVPTQPFRFASTDGWIRRRAPLLGEHNAEILGELGVTADELAALEADHVIGSRPR